MAIGARGNVGLFPVEAHMLIASSECANRSRLAACDADFHTNLRVHACLVFQVLGGVSAAVISRRVKGGRRAGALLESDLM